LVGSSIRITLAGSRSILASSTRLRMPPEHSPEQLLLVLALEVEARDVRAASSDLAAEGICALPSVMLSKTDFASSRIARDWSR
jgi:hypothetical protein